MNKTKYIGMDVHAATTTIAVLDAQGRRIMEVTLATQASTLIDFVRGLRGRLQLTFEESNCAAWLTEVLSPYVEKLIVCNPRKNALLKRGNKSDPVDALKLAQLLYAGLLTPVYHDPSTRHTLKELARSYQTVVRDATRVMNRLKALYRARGIPCAGTRVYSPRFRQRWFEQLPKAGVQPRATLLYAQLDLLQQLRKQARHALLAESRKQPAQRILRTVPGLGPVRVALLLALIQTPYRFRSKRQLWSYSGLGLITRDSAQYQVVHGQIIATGKAATVRGLNPEHNRELKAIFKGAAERASRHSGPLDDFYRQRVEQGMRPELARLTVARKIATLTLTLWKKGEPYDAQRLTTQAA